MRELLVLILFAVTALWRQAAPDPPKKASADAQAKILKLELQQSRIESQYYSCRATNFQEQINKTSAQIVEVKAEALKEAKLDPKEWDVNLESFEFVKLPPPAEKK